MSTTFRPYAPDQMLLLPADLRAWLPEGHLAHHVRDLGDGVDLTAFYAPYAGGRSAQRALCTADDGEGAAVCVCDGGVLVARDRAEAGRGRGVPGSGGGQLSATSDAVRVPAAALVGLQGAVCSGGASGARRPLGEKLVESCLHPLEHRLTPANRCAESRLRLLKILPYGVAADAELQRDRPTATTLLQNGVADNMNLVHPQHLGQPSSCLATERMPDKEAGGGSLLQRWMD